MVFVHLFEAQVLVEFDGGKPLILCFQNGIFAAKAGKLCEHGQSQNHA